MNSPIKKSLTLLLLLLSSVAFSQKDTTFTKLSERYELSAVAELGFLAVLDHKIQFSNSGTYFDYRRNGGQNVLFPINRWSLELKSKRNTFYALYQPLRLESTVLLLEDLVVEEGTFSAGTGVNLLYNFPFYRMSYTREFAHNSPNFDFAFGGTIQIRNATITFESTDGSMFRANRDIGIVPAFKIKSTYHFNKVFYTELEADGIYAPVSYLNGSDNEIVGAILDGSLRVGAQVEDHVKAYVNMRYLGGGAVGTSDDEPGPGDGYVKNWLHFMTVTAGLRYEF